MERGKIGIVTGLSAEARWLHRAGFMVQAGGGTPLGAERAAQALVRQGAQGLVSFGLAGGLKPKLAPGAVLVPPAVIEGARTYICDYALMEFLGGSTGAPMLAGTKIAATAHEKALLYRRSHPVAVDLESGAVARVAAARGLPFAVLRAVADPAERDLPPAAAVALKDDGSLDMAKILASVFRNPRQIPALLNVGRDAKAARAALLARVAKLPPRSR
jgi:adenosylhomocysteine nucleosidase